MRLVVEEDIGGTSVEIAAENDANGAAMEDESIVQGSRREAIRARDFVRREELAVRSKGSGGRAGLETDAPDMDRRRIQVGDSRS